MSKFEYCEEETIDSINSLASRGWEVVAASLKIIAKKHWSEQYQESYTEEEYVWFALMKRALD